MFTELILLFACIIIYDYYRKWSATITLKNLRIVSKIPFIGTLLVLSTFTTDNFYIKWPQFIKRYGKTFYAVLMGHIIVVTVDHRLVDKLLSSQVHLNKHFIYGLLKDWLGEGLLVSSGKRWQQMRKIITPTFHFTILEKFVDIFNRQSDIFIQKLKIYADGKTVLNIYDFVALLTLDVIAEAAMGVSIKAQLNDESDFVKSVRIVTDITSNSFVRINLAVPILHRLTSPQSYFARKENIHIIHEFVMHIIKKRQEYFQKNPEAWINLDQPLNDLGIKNRLALLDVLLQVNINGEPLTVKQIRDEVNTFMFEGHDTTTSAISFCLYALSRHPVVQNKLYKEICNHLGSDVQQPVTLNKLQNLEYLNCCIKESLRLYPPIMAIGRALNGELQLDDYAVPKGSNIIILLWEMLRDPEIFPDPCNYEPERHLKNNSKFPLYAFIPFSAGPRNCIGQRFALYEMRTVIIKVLQKFELVPLGKEVQPTMKLVLRSNTGVNVGLKQRLQT